MNKIWWIFLCFNFPEFVFCQIANYVNNPGFETALPTATMNPYEGTKYWGAIDTLKCGSHRLYSKSLGSVPLGFGGYQNPKTGNNFIGTSFYCDLSTCGEVRWYPRNRLKQNLTSNRTYCVKYHVVITNTSPLAIDGFAALAGSSGVDTIKYCSKPLTYLTPQIEFQGGIITDTLNWIAVTGTFTADGTEKYLVLGNFKSNANTQTVVSNASSLPALAADILIDDVSLIDIDLPAYAGKDTTCIPGDSIFIGREPDIGIDEACQWFKLPNMSTPIATVAGLYVKPITTTTYVVRQQLWCSGVKYDTVVVYEDAVGIKRISLMEKQLIISPQPSDQFFSISVPGNDLSLYFSKIEIINQKGELMRLQIFANSDGKHEISVSDLPQGIYLLKFTGRNDFYVLNKKLVVMR